MFSLHRYLLVLVCALSVRMVMGQCNGHPELCDKRFNEVAFLTTHNAFNAEENGFALPNHTYGITRQLNDGVRGLMIDVYDEGGVATVYHSLAFLGTAPLESNLSEIKAFLDANPGEVVTIIFECYADFNMVEAAFLSTDLLQYAHSQPLGQPWPTLQQMIENGKRLVVLSDRNDAPTNGAWYHYVWDHAVETPFSNSSNSDFSCEFNRGDPQNDLFILNHFATDPTLGVGRTDLSELANEFNFFYNRARQCELELGKFPNFPTIDFHELGEPLRVVDSLNLAQWNVGVEEIGNEKRISVFPNPVFDRLSVALPSSNPATVSVYISKGQLVHRMNSLSERNLTVDMTSYPSGIYLLQVEHVDAISSFRVLKLDH